MPSSAKTSAGKSTKSARVHTSKSSRVAGDTPKRVITPPSYTSFRLAKRIRHKRPRVAGSYGILKQSLSTLFSQKRLFFGIVFVYLLLTIVLVKGFSVNSNIPELKDTLGEVLGGSFSRLTTGVALYSVLLGNINATNGSQQAAGYQSVLLVVVSLALIWGLRQTKAKGAQKKKLRAKQAFYGGQYALIPFILIVMVIGVQLLPIALASFLYSTVIVGGLAVTVLEKLLWFLLIGLTILLSLYMVTSSVFALYIVTLPEVWPMQALRSARELVRYRRWTIMRKILFLPITLLITSALVTIPVVLAAPALAEWLFFVMGMCALAIIHSYMYTLYRELL